MSNTRHANGGGQGFQVPADERGHYAKLQRLMAMNAPVGTEHIVSVQPVMVHDVAADQSVVSSFIELWTLTATGPHLQYLNPQQALDLAAELTKYATLAKLGLSAVSPLQEGTG